MESPTALPPPTSRVRFPITSTSIQALRNPSQQITSPLPTPPPSSRRKSFFPKPPSLDSQLPTLGRVDLQVLIRAAAPVVFAKRPAKPAPVEETPTPPTPPPVPATIATTTRQATVPLPLRLRAPLPLYHPLRPFPLSPPAEPIETVTAPERRSSSRQRRPTARIREGEDISIPAPAPPRKKRAAAKRKAREEDDSAYPEKRQRTQKVNDEDGGENGMDEDKNSLKPPPRARRTRKPVRRASVESIETMASAATPTPTDPSPSRRDKGKDKIDEETP